MVSIRFASVFAAAAASLLMTAAAQTTTGTPTIKNPITTPTTTLPANALQDVGCYATPTPLEDHGPYSFQSPGNCQLVCLELGKPVMGLSDGTDCWCGDKLPAHEWKIDNSTCSTTCAGTDKVMCGGPGVLWVVLTGQTRNKVEEFNPSSSSSSKSSSATSSSAPSSTAVVTPSATPQTDSKPNTAGIAAGVVVGIVGLAAIIGGVWFFLRRRRQKQAEEDYRRNAANVDSFVSGGKLHTSNSSMNDSRLDPSFTDRRQSNGSIADNEDYSRRILKVTNV